jgi:hypothetical protein
VSVGSRLRNVGSHCDPTKPALAWRSAEADRPRTAKLEIGWSDISAASSVLAFWLPEVRPAFLAA